MQQRPLEIQTSKVQASSVVNHHYHHYPKRQDLERNTHSLDKNQLQRREQHASSQKNHHRLVQQQQQQQQQPVTKRKIKPTAVSQQNLPVRPFSTSKKTSQKDGMGTLTANSSFPRKELAFIIPFRESTDGRSQGLRRNDNLQDWLTYMRDYLPKDIIQHSHVYIIEQSERGIFNKGALFNAGFHFMKNGSGYD